MEAKHQYTIDISSMLWDKILADYNTCQKAWDIGMRTESLCRWEYYFDGIIWRTRCVSSFEPIEGHFCYSAPTAEEVPLPDELFYIESICHCIHFDIKWITFDNIDIRSNKCAKSTALECNPNEATARLKMAIWLIENVPEARQWYVANGYMREEA